MTVPLAVATTPGFSPLFISSVKLAAKVVGEVAAVVVTL